MLVHSFIKYTFDKYNLSTHVTRLDKLKSIWVLFQDLLFEFIGGSVYHCCCHRKLLATLSWRRLYFHRWRNFRWKSWQLQNLFSSFVLLVPRSATKKNWIELVTNVFLIFFCRKSPLPQPSPIEWWNLFFMVLSKQYWPKEYYNLPLILHFVSLLYFSRQNP